MSLLNYNAKEIHCKIIYYGIKGSGKTSSIKWICQNTKGAEPLDLLSMPLQTKPSVFFDFLPLDVGVIRGLKTRFHIYSIPGGELFDSSQKLLLKGADGVVFVADSQKEKMLDNKNNLIKLKKDLLTEGLQIEKLPMALQYNKRDLQNIHSAAQMRAELNHYNHPDFASSALTGSGVFETLKTVLKMVITVLKGGSAL